MVALARGSITRLEHERLSGLALWLGERIMQNACQDLRVEG